jgi:hypothetical protein
MRSTVLLCLVSVLLLSACGGDDPSGDGGGLGAAGGGSRAGAPARVSEMSQVPYTATHYRAVVSGSSAPTRVLMEVVGEYWSLQGQYVFLCDESEHYCAQKIDGKLRADLAISGDLTQLILSSYDATGRLNTTASFVRR